MPENKQMEVTEEQVKQQQRERHQQHVIAVLRQEIGELMERIGNLSFKVHEQAQVIQLLQQDQAAGQPDNKTK